MKNWIISLKHATIHRIITIIKRTQYPAFASLSDIKHCDFSRLLLNRFKYFVFVGFFFFCPYISLHSYTRFSLFYIIVHQTTTTTTRPANFCKHQTKLITLHFMSVECSLSFPDRIVLC